MMVFTFVACDNLYGNEYSHIGFADCFLDSGSSVSYVIHNSSSDSTHDYAIIVGK